MTAYQAHVTVTMYYAFTVELEEDDAIVAQQAVMEQLVDQSSQRTEVRLEVERGVR